MKVRVKKVKRKLADDNLSDLFNQMLGSNGISVPIAYPRYQRVATICRNLTSLFEKLSGSPYMRQAQHSTVRAEIDEFCTKSREEIAVIFNQTIPDVQNLSDEELATFTRAYEHLRHSTIVNAYVQLCDRLVPYRHDLESIDTLSPIFIYNIPGVSWLPFPFTSLDVKAILTEHTGSITTTFFLTVLHKSWTLSKTLYDEITSPDIDTDVCIAMIMNSMDRLHKIPELNRCDRAFKVIKDSVALLKSRFNGYYREYVTTGDSSIILQHFLLDVSENSKTDPVTTRQFRRIAEYYERALEAQNKLSPTVKVLLDRIKQAMNYLERGTTNLNAADPESAANSDVVGIVPAIAIPDTEDNSD